MMCAHLEEFQYKDKDAFSKLFDEKLGIHWDTVKTAKYSTGVNPFYDISPVEAAQLQYSTEAMYATFLKRVADGRGMTTDSVHQIAQGRVWVGERARQIGLVDEVGDLDRAMVIAAELSGLEKYRLVEYPKQIEPLPMVLGLPKAFISRLG